MVIHSYKKTPADCLNLSFEQSVDILKKKISQKELDKAFDISKSYPSPIVNSKDTAWAKTAKIVGINPRITKTFWGIVKYAISFPEEAIHIMPLWETGDGSLYVQNSWKVNPEFLDDDLIKLGFKTPESQLKLIINVLHAMGKIAGFDCLPHVDSFSEIVLSNPKYFEWIKLNEEKTAQITDIDYNLIYKDVEEIIINHLNAPHNLFELDEEKRLNIIFPKNADNFERRMELRNVIREKGYETIPVVEHAPMRPVLFDKIVNNGSENWAEFKVPGKLKEAKIIGSVTPYKWYKIDKQGFPVKNGIEDDVWDYFINHMTNFQREYNFDFLRADMAHNQISHSHQENSTDYNMKEFWCVLKEKIREEKPYFVTFAEAFYGDYYIDGIQDMENKNFDIVLGYMNFKDINEDYFNWLNDFLNPFRENFNFSPCVTTFTNDCDLEINQHFFDNNQNNEMRFFLSLFLNLPGYMGMGFETKSLNPSNKNEFSNQYIRKQDEDYVFGENNELFNFITQMREFYIKYKSIIKNAELNLLELNNKDSFCFMYDEKLIFLVQLDETNKNIFAGFNEIYNNGNCAIYERE